MAVPKKRVSLSKRKIKNTIKYERKFNNIKLKYNILDIIEKTLNMGNFYLSYLKYQNKKYNRNKKKKRIKRRRIKR